MKHWLYLSLLLPTLPGIAEQESDLFAAKQQDQDQQVQEQPQPQEKTFRRKTPKEIQQELKEEQAKYEHDLKLLNPWYTGLLITPSATMVPPGWAMWQPYIYFTDTYANYDDERHVVDRPNLYSLKVQPVIVQAGVTDSVDATLVMSGV